MLFGFIETLIWKFTSHRGYRQILGRQSSILLGQHFQYGVTDMTDLYGISLFVIGFQETLECLYQRRLLSLLHI